ncbi:hypothetical protein J6590_022893 [Homalodisca vitripennis]|nr:hypothetical protein J6590_022893 [Homalodisca vitripennis]
MPMYLSRGLSAFELRRRYATGLIVGVDYSPYVNPTEPPCRRITNCLKCVPCRGEEFTMPLDCLVKPSDKLFSQFLDNWLNKFIAPFLATRACPSSGLFGATVRGRLPVTTVFHYSTKLYQVTCDCPETVACHNRFLILHQTLPGPVRLSEDGSLSQPYFCTNPPNSTRSGATVRRRFPVTTVSLLLHQTLPGPVRLSEDGHNFVFLLHQTLPGPVRLSEDGHNFVFTTPPNSTRSAATVRGRSQLCFYYSTKLYQVRILTQIHCSWFGKGQT